MLLPRLAAAAAVLLLIVARSVIEAEGKPHRIVVDTDVATDDLLALLYLLKLNTSQFEAVTINANTWSSAGHAVNQIYDLLYMMGRDDIAVGVGGEGGILPNGTILPNVGGYLPIIDQGMTTTGGCRYRQAIPVGLGGRLDVDANYGIRKDFLPQGKRKYTPLEQPTAQEVLIEKVSAGPTTLFVIGAHTNVAIFLMNNPHLKKNVERIYIMGGGVRSSNPTGCCPQNTSSSCVPQQCGDRGNMFTDYNTNPYAEFNIFGDPFAAYQVIHSGIPITLVPIDASYTIPITKEFFEAFEKSQDTYEAQYCFKTLKITRDTWFDDEFYSSYFMWDSFMVGVAVSVMSKPNNYDGENEFSEMEYMNITVITSNKPYGISDGSNPLIDGLNVPKFNLEKDGVHSGHIQQGLRDPLCFVKSGKGKCQEVVFSFWLYTGEKTQKFGATRDTDYPELRQPLAMEVWESVLQTMKPGSNITVLTNGPLTNLEKVVLVKNISSRIQEVYVVGGHISRNTEDKGNVFSVPSNQYAEFNMFLDPLAAKTVFESEVNITLIPLSTQRKVSSFATVIGRLHATRKTPEVAFSKLLLATLHRLKQIHNRYHHMDTFLGEILGAVVLADKGSSLKPKFEKKPIKVLASGDESTDGKMVVDEKHGKLVRILSNVEENAYYNLYANKLGDQYQSAKVGSFKEQTRKWRHPRDDKPSQEKCAQFHGYKAFLSTM
ncbi:uncharacterized protein LOC123922676 [Trifolium pratense]|uniref:uncharacterized protein LOC123922676 n=1 Tax=Trifolium pratense TaxID=57577 RepID=UPI001E69304B|nr:uncharacterized protein LOC123922676 [Trifolium pratense]